MSTTFVGLQTPIDPATSTRIVNHSWREGCPVPLVDLRYLKLSYVGFDQKTHIGEMIVHRDAAKVVIDAFHVLFRARFPIERMVLVDDFDADDDRSTRANNTSAFNCRAKTGKRVWSQHAYGRAVDINPIQNPYVYGDGHVLDPNAVPYLERSRIRPGMVVAGDLVTSSFIAAGWGWGGNFRSIKDYQHFSATGL